MVAGIKIYLIFKGIPASPALRSAVESLHPHFKNRAVRKTALFFVRILRNYIDIPSNLPLAKGGYKFWRAAFQVSSSILYIGIFCADKFYRKTLNFLLEKFAEKKIISTFVIE